MGLAVTELRVFIDLAGRTIPCGVAYVNATRGRPSTTLVYDPAYVADP